MPIRLRYYLQRDKGALNAALRIFLRVVQQNLQTYCPGTPKADPTSLHLGAVAFIHRFGSSLNTHVHFHVCVIDGVFEALPDGVAYAHGGGFSVDAGGRIETPDRAGLERLLRYCARPPFARGRLKQRALIWSTVAVKATQSPCNQTSTRVN